MPIGLVVDEAISNESFVAYLALLSLQPASPVTADGPDARGAAEVHPVAIARCELAEMCRVRSVATMRRHVAGLVSRGWLTVSESCGSKATVYACQVPRGRRHASRFVGISQSLALHRELSPGAKRLYAHLCIKRLPGLAGFTGYRRDLVKSVAMGGERLVRQRIAELRNAGWLRIDRTNQRHVHVYVPLDPHRAAREAERDAAAKRIADARTKGEAIMKEMLNVLLPGEPCRDNAREGDIVNPITGQWLELDRRYDDLRLAFEFNGRQHYELTEHFRDRQALMEQRYRDFEKRDQAAAKGMTVVPIHVEDLSFTTLQRKIPVPTAILRAEDPVVAFLEQYGQDHMQRTARARQTEAARQAEAARHTEATRQTEAIHPTEIQQTEEKRPVAQMTTGP